MLSADSGDSDRGEELKDYTAQGPSKKIAMEAASRLMALSGHCVRDSAESNHESAPMTFSLVTVRLALG